MSPDNFQDGETPEQEQTAVGCDDLLCDGSASGQTSLLEMFIALGIDFRMWLCPNNCKASVTWDDTTDTATCRICGTRSHSMERSRGGNNE